MSGATFYCGKNRATVRGWEYHLSMNAVRCVNGYHWFKAEANGEIGESGDTHRLLLLIKLLADSHRSCSFMWVKAEHVPWLRQLLSDGIAQGKFIGDSWKGVAEMLAKATPFMPVVVNYDVNYSSLLSMVNTGDRRRVTKAINWQRGRPKGGMFRVGPDNIAWQRF